MAESITDAILAGIVAISADAVICVDQAQRIVFFNHGAEQIFGYSATEITGESLDLLIPERFRANHAAHVRAFGESELRARRMGERGQISGLRKNGEEFPAEAAISHLGHGDEMVYSVVLRDVTERRRAHEIQRLLAEAGETLASSLGTEDTLRNVTRLTVPRLAEACIIDIYTAGRFHGGAVAHLDSDRAAAIERKRAEHPPDVDDAGIRGEVLRTGKTRVISTSSELSASTMLWSEHEIFDSPPSAAIVLPLSARGQQLGVMTLYRQRGEYDANDLFLAEEISRRAALAIDNARLHDLVHVGIQARDDMIGIVSHDLRNPVNAIRMLTGVMLGRQRELSLPAEVINHTAVMREAAEQMDALIADLLDVTRVEAGRLSVSALPEDTEELLGDTLRTLAPVTAEKSIRLKLHAPDDIPSVLADRERIGQALSNLVGNAVKFSPAGSEIIVRVSVLDTEVLISVSDKGMGMNAEQLSHAFDRFWQSSRTDRQGAGLGLAIAKGIVDAHGGRIWAESSPGAGSTFYFTLLRAASGDGGTASA